MIAQVDLALSVPAEHKALVTASTLAALWLAEHTWPAHDAGRASWRHDVRNLTLGAANALLVAALLTWVLPAWSDQHGLLAVLQPAPWVGFLVAIVGLDLWMYVWHRANHRVPLLWRFHRVHHADTRMDASTAVRFHPAEVLLGTLGRVPVALALGATPEHLVVYEMILLPVILFHHSNVRVLPAVDRALRLLIVTPSLHRVHHSPLRHETDSNYGSVFSAWDRLARSFRGRRDASESRYGLTAFRDAATQRLAGLLALPFRSADARRTDATP